MESVLFFAILFGIIALLLGSRRQEPEYQLVRIEQPPRQGGGGGALLLILLALLVVAVVGGGLL